MANKLKKSVISPPLPEEKEVKVEKPERKVPPRAKSPLDNLKKDKDEGVDFKKLAKDERTWKIIGTVSLLISIFLFIAFVSYFFTWKDDQKNVFVDGSTFLWEGERKASNLLGRLGAYISDFFIWKGFGIASFLFCTFFFVVGINLLFNRKVFSIWLNLKYVTFGVLIASVAFAFMFSGAEFLYGGLVGKMISGWLTNFLGHIGTAALLLVVAVSYLIWQFNPAFNFPQRQLKEEAANFSEEEEEEGEEEPAEVLFSSMDAPVLTINEQFASKANSLKGEGGMLVPDAASVAAVPAFAMVEKEDESFEQETPVEKEIIADLMHKEEPAATELPLEIEEYVPPVRRKAVTQDIDLPLEIKKVEDVVEEEDPEREKGYSDLAPYEPTLDLRDYKYPGIELLETHGSEKIVQDPGELEANKNQIINTLKNYDISIQKISATVGPTVTLYEIVPAAGVRISRIKNLEDDIALSLAALGIRIIAPIPGKGTIGIEVPNHKKSIVSMKTLLASEKFQNNNYSLPIAIGKKIDNELFVVDLAGMPHLLMAGATGQGKSVGLNAILVSLLYKKHPSQLKFVLIDPKKVELSVYRHIENHFLAKLPGEEESIITDTKKVINTLNALCIEMDNRYDLLKDAEVRNIKEYNTKFIHRRLNPEKGHRYLPYIVLIIDELADLMMTAGKEVEQPIARLAQLARAIGIHLVVATQRP
ncbi:MAG TPA: DNA translocase FtsK 4TM domain-containing protein, partial [Flavisolibacter sp.]